MLLGRPVAEKPVRKAEFRKMVQDLLDAQVVLVEISVDGLDKYGRLLGTIRTLPDRVDVVTELVARGYALPYDGGKKPARHAREGVPSPEEAVHVEVHKHRGP
jgi:endonuclease YncB( thermonuclease family)